LLILGLAPLLALFWAMGQVVQELVLVPLSWELAQVFLVSLYLLNPALDHH
jgi:hypothetical protein